MVRFQYSLARELGMTRAELIHRVSTQEIIEWMAFFKLEQEDQQRASERAEDAATARQMARGLR